MYCKHYTQLDLQYVHRCSQTITSEWDVYLRMGSTSNFHNNLCSYLVFLVSVSCEYACVYSRICLHCISFSLNLNKKVKLFYITLQFRYVHCYTFPNISGILRYCSAVHHSKPRYILLYFLYFFHVFFDCIY